jgi:predicted ester cyclase
MTGRPDTFRSVLRITAGQVRDHNRIPVILGRCGPRYLSAVVAIELSIRGTFGNSLGDIVGAENLAGLLGTFIGALPDLYAAEQDITAENDLVMVRLVVTATVKGSLLGVPGDGKPVRWNAVDIYRVTDGKISEEWAADDIATIMAQLGVFSPPWAA